MCQVFPVGAREGDWIVCVVFTTQGVFYNVPRALGTDAGIVYDTPPVPGRTRAFRVDIGVRGGDAVARGAPRYVVPVGGLLAQRACHSVRQRVACAKIGLKVIRGTVPARHAVGLVITHCVRERKAVFLVQKLPTARRRIVISIGTH